MKKLMKGFNFKAFFLNHGEKVAFGVVALALLPVFLGTQWSRFAMTPQDIMNKAKATQEALARSVWPETKRAEFGLQDYAGQALAVRGPMNVAPYEYSTNIWWPLYRKQELAKEPEMVAVVDLIATPGRFTLGMNPSKAAGDMLADASSGDGAALSSDAPAEEEMSEFDEQFGPARPAGAGPGGPGAMVGPGAFGPGAMGPGPGGGHDSGGGAFPPMMAGPAPSMTGAHDSDVADAYLDPSMMMPGMESSGMGMMPGGGLRGGMIQGPPGLETRGERFVAVRGIWPIWEQMGKLQRALNLQTTNDARTYLELIDFSLERQTAIAGDQPWSGAWEQLDIQRAKDVLDEVYEYSPEPHHPQFIDSVITMPLPARRVGQWGRLATHPKLDTLPPAELEREEKLQQALIEEYEKLRLKQDKDAGRAKGFAKQHNDTRSMASTIFNSEYAGEFQQNMSGMIQQDRDMRGLRPQDLKMRLTAVGRNLLFRYFDFDVRPGYAYRYRVRLILRNPNYDRPLDQVLEPSVAEGLDRETPWSEPSTVAVVDRTVDYFLEDVERDPATETRTTATKPLARVDFYEWDTTKGTMIHDKVELQTYGQFVGGTRKSLQLDLGKPLFKDAEVSFRSEDLFVDTYADARIDPAQHPDLQIPAQQRGRVGLLPEAIVVTETGELGPLDPSRNRSRQNYLATYVKKEREAFETIKNAEDKPMMGGGDMMGFSADMEEMMESQMMGQMPGGKKKKSRKPKNMGGSSSSSGAHSGS